MRFPSQSISGLKIGLARSFTGVPTERKTDSIRSMRCSSTNSCRPGLRATAAGCLGTWEGVSCTEINARMDKAVCRMVRHYSRVSRARPQRTPTGRRSKSFAPCI